jgi:hypothetical protein
VHNKRETLTDGGEGPHFGPEEPSSSSKVSLLLFSLLFLSFFLQFFVKKMQIPLFSKTCKKNSPPLFEGQTKERKEKRRTFNGSIFS